MQDDVADVIEDASFPGEPAALLDAKVAGQAIVSPPVEEATAVQNLLEALKQSVAETQHASNGSSNGARNKKVRSKASGTSSSRLKK